MDATDSLTEYKYVSHLNYCRNIILIFSQVLGRLRFLCFHLILSTVTYYTRAMIYVRKYLVYVVDLYRDKINKDMYSVHRYVYD